MSEALQAVAGSLDGEEKEEAKRLCRQFNDIARERGDREYVFHYPTKGQWWLLHDIERAVLGRWR